MPISLSKNVSRLWPALMFVCLLSPIRPSAQTAEELEALRALGYVSHPDESAADPRTETGPSHGEVEEVAPGYVLITLIPEARAVLVDTRGQTVKTWTGPRGSAWSRAKLQPDGDVLVLSRKNARPEAISRYDWNGRLLWRRSSSAHHDLDVLDDGRILSLGQRQRRDGDLFFQDHSILVFSPRGELQRDISLFDLLRSNPEIYRLPRTSTHPKAVREDGRVDLLHTNAIAHMPFPALSDRAPLYCEACVLVTVRHQNLVAVFDIEAERLVWTWGPEELQFPHEGRWLENGNILIFDNGTAKRGYSRIVEVEPQTGRIVWTYRDPRPGGFFTAGRGTSQALPGGHVLIASSNQSKVFEINRDGRVVWSYQTRGADGRLVSVRAQKYPPEMVDNR